MFKIVSYKGNDIIFFRNGKPLRILHVGEANLKTRHGNINLKSLSCSRD